MRLVNPKASTFLAILEIFCSGVCVCELLAYGTSAPIGRIMSFSAKFTDARLSPKGNLKPICTSAKTPKSRAP
jgi:hypothetical protein